MGSIEPAPASLLFLRRPAMPKGRVESFSDCVIAFAITLLILDIHLEDVGTKTNSAGMIHAIIALAPHFSIYVISFLICTVAWISHHEFMHDLEYVDPGLLWLNSLYLMWIAFLPFPTGLLGNHPDQPVAVAVYGSVCSVTCLSFSAMLWYAAFPGRLMKKAMSDTKVRRDLWLSLCFAILYIAGVAAGLFVPSLGLFLYAAIPASYTISRLASFKRTVDAR
jgi:uncharacterized membrane protein